VTGSWDCDWSRSNYPWDSLYLIIQVCPQKTVARLSNDKLVWPNAISSRSSDCSWQHLTSWTRLSRGWYNFAKHYFCTMTYTASDFQHLVHCLPFHSLRVLFSRRWISHLPSSRLHCVRKHLSRCKHNARRLLCSSILHHQEIFMNLKYRIVTMPGWT
jgi:hypothetical protein